MVSGGIIGGVNAASNRRTGFLHEQSSYYHL
jgi:hypothetical protein